MPENAYQASVILRVKDVLPESFVTKLSTDFVQGIPDLLILNWDRWAILECKMSARAPYRPNQEYYIDLFNRMSFSAMICPENEEEVLHELQQALQPSRNSRIPRSQLPRVAQLRRR